MSSNLPELLFKLASFCFGLQMLSGWLLRRRLKGDEVLSRALFANPVLKGQREIGRLLRVKFFWPFVAAPIELSECVYTTVTLFWVSRLAGFGFATCIAVFFASIFLQAGT